MTDISARLACASSFILQSPPGEVNDVFDDVRALVADDEALEAGILPALKQYNTEQFIAASLPDDQQLLICETGRVPSEDSRFIEPKTSIAYKFDHIRLTSSDPVEIVVDQECEVIRVELEKAAEAYEKEHFAGTGNDGSNNGVCKVFTVGQTTLKKTASEPVAQEDAKEPETEAATKELPAPSEDTEALEEESAVDEAVASVPTEAVNSAAVLEEPQQSSADDSEMTSASTPAPEPAVKDTTMSEQTPAPEESAEAQETAAEESESGPELGSVPAPEPEETFEPLDKKFTLLFVGNKYNPSNFWTGRWRSSYTLDLTSSEPTLTGTIQLHVHFFEQGNVQLTTTHIPQVTLPESLSASSSPVDIAKAVIKAIGKVEQEYQLDLNDAYRDMSEKTFRNLRRALPITRQKMDWAKVASYKLGKDIGGTGTN